MKPSSIEQARAEVRNHIARYEFDCALVITANTETKQMMDFWTFADHPSNLTAADLKFAAWQMACATAEQLKGDVENPTRRQLNRVFHKRLVLKFEHEQYLPAFILAIAWPDPTKPCFFRLEISINEIGLMWRWYDDDKFWAFTCLIGLIRFRISRDK